MSSYVTCYIYIVKCPHSYDLWSEFTTECWGRDVYIIIVVILLLSLETGIGAYSPFLEWTVVLGPVWYTFYCAIHAFKHIAVSANEHAIPTGRSCTVWIPLEFQIKTQLKINVHWSANMSEKLLRISDFAAGCTEPVLSPAESRWAYARRFYLSYENIICTTGRTYRIVLSSDNDQATATGNGHRTFGEVWICHVF